MRVSISCTHILSKIMPKMHVMWKILQCWGMNKNAGQTHPRSQGAKCRPIRMHCLASHGSKGLPEHATPTLGQQQFTNLWPRSPQTNDSAKGVVGWMPDWVGIGYFSITLQAHGTVVAFTSEYSNGYRIQGNGCTLTPILVSPRTPR